MSFIYNLVNLHFSHNKYKLEMKSYVCNRKHNILIVRYNIDENHCQKVSSFQIEMNFREYA